MSILFALSAEGALNLTGMILAFLLPAGAMMVGWGGLAPGRSRVAASAGLFALAVSAVMTAAVGFAFQFGGIWHVVHLEAYRSLDQLWTLPDPENTWSVAGLTGFFLAGDLGPEAFGLFVHQLPLVMAAALIPVMALAGRARNLVTATAGLVIAAIIVPLAGHWVWSGGWLAALGNNLHLGHGYVDIAGAGPVYLTGGLVALVGLALSRSRLAQDEPAQLPEPHFPLLAVLGCLLFGIGWMAWVAADPLHPAGPTLDIARGLANGLLSASAAALVSQLYSWLASSRLDPLLASRGWLAGWVAASAAAPFMEAAPALAVGALAGILMPLAMYGVDRLLHLDDRTAAVSLYGVSGLLGALALGILADGQSGAGWNGVGVKEYLLVAGQGVTGLLPAPGLTLDSGQMTAQLAGVGTMVAFGLVAGGVMMGIAQLAGRAWEGSSAERAHRPADTSQLQTESSGDAPSAPQQES